MIMTTLIEKDSPVPVLIVTGAIFLLLIGGTLGLAYAGGVFTGKNEVAANDKRLVDQALLHTSHSVAPEPTKP